MVWKFIFIETLSFVLKHLVIGRMVTSLESYLGGLWTWFVTEAAGYFPWGLLEPSLQTRPTAGLPRAD